MKPEVQNQDVALANFKNEVVYVSSFTVSQKEMLQSVLRVTRTTEADWTITKEPAQTRYSDGMKEIQEGKHSGFAKMCTRVFYPDGYGNFQNKKMKLNSLLHLPVDSIDEATKFAVARSKALK